MSIMLVVLSFLVVFGTLCFQRASMLVFAIGIGVWLFLLSFFAHFGLVTQGIVWSLYAIFFLLFGVPIIRRTLLTSRILPIFKQVMPKLSTTEAEALTAGSVGFTGELFSGMPNWHLLKDLPLATLSAEEQAFMEGPVETLCAMIDDWQITKNMSIPSSVWNFIKQAGFFGMIIPKQYGGKEFSAALHSAVIVKVTALSASIATAIGVPNSLGPAELLLHYGLDEQKNYYLPRLATGEEIPCFALTSPVAGSDAGSITDSGVVFKDTDGLLKIRLNWDKRYITLAPLATVLGLAFKLYDPEHLLGTQTALGITCALIPTNTPGVVTGRRHFPLHCAFPNGPTQGVDVVVSIDNIIGGVAMAGHGWRMLMECLAAGRAISLPSIVTGGARKYALASGVYGRIRRQFNTYIAQFGGVESVLARIAADTYAIDATRLFALAPLDHGEKPVVESAISKYHCTEMSRRVANHAMDLHGGKAICMGPNNYMAQGYIELPISITVEGANILTRSMIIFGQGAIRCHPFVLNELNAANNTDKKKGLIDFDKAFFGHVGFVMSNKVRTLLLGLSHGHLAKVPKGPFKRYYQHFSRYSAAFALTADLSMLSLGANLKRMENISARLGDILSYLYIGSAVLKYVQQGNSIEEQPIVEFICQDLLYKIQQTFAELWVNFPNRFLAGILRIWVSPLGQRMQPPKDKLGHLVAKLLLQPSSVRQRFSQGLCLQDLDTNPLGKMEHILTQVIAIEPLEKRISKAVREGLISGQCFSERVRAAQEKGIVSFDEASLLFVVDQLRMSMIHVDDFAPEEIAHV